VELLTRYLLEEALTRLGDLGIGLTVCAGNARPPAGFAALTAGGARPADPGTFSLARALVVNDADLADPQASENEANNPGEVATCLMIRSDGTPDRLPCECGTRARRPFTPPSRTGRSWARTHCSGRWLGAGTKTGAPGCWCRGWLAHINHLRQLRQARSERSGGCAGLARIKK
jgi:hypothetical protein